MSLPLTSCERILRTIRGEPVDRVPIAPPIPWDPSWGIEGREPDGWMTEPNYRAVRALAEQHCDEITGARGVAGLFGRGLMHIPPEAIERLPVEQAGILRRRRTTLVHTPKGDLRTVDESDEGVNTGWYTEPLLKDKDDVERVLSVPYRFDKPDVAPFFEHRQRLAGRAVTQVNVSTPMVCISRMFHFTQFLEWCASEFDLINLLIRTEFDRISERLDWVLGQGVGPLVWFGGSEQATPPMMSPALYDAFVVKYDKPLFDIVHKHGCYVHVHCHGKVSGILGKLVEMGADLLDPVEPPPQGDIEMGEAKRRVAGRITLLGNIEFCDLEFAEPDEIEQKAKSAIEDGGKEHTILYPSATAIARISDRQRDNAIRYIEAGLKYGSFQATFRPERSPSPQVDS